MDINSLPSYTTIRRVLLPDGKWYYVKDQSFMAEGNWFTFTNGQGVKADIHGPLSSIRAIMTVPAT